VPHLFPNFRAGGALVCQRIGRIPELIHIECAGDFFGESGSHILVIFRMAARHVRTGDSHFSAERFHMRDFFLRHFIGNHQQDAVAFRAGNQRKTQTGVPCCGFNDGAAGPQFPFVLRRFNHR
jgi:hypothetical protein